MSNRNVESEIDVLPGERDASASVGDERRRDVYGAGLTMSQPALIYAACQRLAAVHPTFSTEDIVLAAWRAAPSEFGLRGYQDAYPNNKKIEAAIYGGKGFVKRGWLAKVAPNTFRIGDVEPSWVVLRTAEERDAVFLARLTGLRAVQLFNEGKKSEILFDHARWFLANGAEERLRAIRQRDDATPGLTALICVADWLRERFARRFEMDERKASA